jgi:hypothetical protein
MTAADFWLLFASEFLYLAAALRCNYCGFQTKNVDKGQSADNQVQKNYN